MVHLDVAIAPHAALSYTCDTWNAEPWAHEFQSLFPVVLFRITKFPSFEQGISMLAVDAISISVEPK
jgi:hypothetical protein